MGKTLASDTLQVGTLQVGTLRAPVEVLALAEQVAIRYGKPMTPIKWRQEGRDWVIVFEQGPKLRFERDTLQVGTLGSDTLQVGTLGSDTLQVGTLQVDTLEAEAGRIDLVDGVSAGEASLAGQALRAKRRTTPRKKV